MAVKFQYWNEVRSVAESHHLDPNLVTAICMIESSGNTKAYRYEPGFWSQYMANNPIWKGADPKRVSASYGLMQTMYPVAVEHGFPTTDAPDKLYLPLVGLDYGCRVFTKLLVWVNKEAADISADARLRAALASYNGGKDGNAADHLPDRNAKYADKVLGMLTRVRNGEFS
jgi:soluble lytic murein transglycosylase-like protein